MQNYSDKEIYNALPEIINESKKLYKKDSDFKKQTDIFAKLLSGKIKELLKNGVELKANAVILACFACIQATCNNIED